MYIRLIRFFRKPTPAPTASLWQVMSSDVRSSIKFIEGYLGINALTLSRMELFPRRLKSSGVGQNKVAELVVSWKSVNEMIFNPFTTGVLPWRVHLLLFITRKYSIINADLKLINAKIHSFYSVDISIRQIEKSCLIEISLSLMYSRMVLMVVCWRYGMPFGVNGCVSTLMNVD